MRRNDAGEFTLFYDFDWTKYGRIKTGGFHYAVIPLYSPYGNVLSKSQIYASYEAPFLRFLNPKISLYHTVNRYLYYFKSSEVTLPCLIIYAS
jgi:hypothetical protein